MNSIFQKEKQKLRLKLVGNKQLSCIRAELNRLLLFSEKEKEAVSIMMILFDKEYVLNTYLKDMAKENRGMQIGLKEGGILSAIETYREGGVSFADIIKKIATKFNLSESDAEAKVKACWQ